MGHKCVDGYHDNKGDKRYAFDFIDGQFRRESLDSSKTYFGMEIELELDEELGERCDYCNGRGREDCEDCDGNGSYDCPNCDGTGCVDCDNCDGTGKIEQTDEETGEITMVDCPDCLGTGQDECSNCDGSGRVKCDNCGGIGSWECSNCDGTGVVDGEGGSSDLYEVPDEHENKLVFEHDGSLDNGFEVITEPMTYNALVNFLRLPFMRKLVGRSQELSSNGIHIHMSRPNMEVLKNLMMILGKTSHDLEALTRSSTYGTWYHRMDTLDTKQIKVYDDGLIKRPRYISTLFDALTQSTCINPDFKENLYRDRYLALNNQNERTIEYRFFNSTNDVGRLVDYLTLVYDMNVFANFYTLCELTTGDYSIGDHLKIGFTVNREAKLSYVRNITQSIIIKYNESLENAPLLDRLIRRELDVVSKGAIYNVGDLVHLDQPMLESNFLVNQYNTRTVSYLDSRKAFEIIEVASQGRLRDTFSNFGQSLSILARDIPVYLIKVERDESRGGDTTFWCPQTFIKGLVEYPTSQEVRVTVNYLGVDE